jgi:2-keto-4-pentenoate hydratase/2-oxohepta-3-ene-1,7-dioic acid hydratase in catechol pathway
MTKQIEFLTGGKGLVQNIYCIGRNYAEHAAELNNPLPDEPVVFLKSGASLRGLEESGVIAFPEETFHHEAELVLYIGKRIEEANDCNWSAVSHLALGLDLTRRDVQNELKQKGLPWTRAKSFRGSAVVSAFIAKDELDYQANIEFDLKINGEMRQSGQTKMMLFNIEAMLSTLLKLHPLEKGDLVFTGTPKGVGPVRRGDKIELTFKGTKYHFAGQL